MFKLPITITESGISPSRTYIIGVYDSVSPTKMHFEKVTLPKSVPNSIKNAKQNYLLDNIEEAETIRIMVCVSIEEYINATHSLFTQNDKEEDIELALSMLHSWNASQENPSETYSGALTSLLKRVSLMDDFDKTVAKLKELALALLQIE